MPERIKMPLEEPKNDRGLIATVRVTNERAVRIREEVCEGMNIRRPGGVPSVAALLDAIFHGKVALRRRDDPEGREFWVGQGELAKAEGGEKRRRRKLWWQKDTE